MSDLLISPLSSDALDIDAIKEKIKDDLIANDVITDINYEGSNISILVQIISYMVYNINASHAMNANQVMLPLSDIRQNIIYLAQQLSYNITRKKSSKMNVTLTIDSLLTNETLTIPQWSEFKCGEYTFLNPDTLQFNESVLSHTVDLIEGDLIDSSIDETLNYVVENDSEYILLNYTDIENDNLYLKIKPNGSSVFSDYFTKQDNLLDFDSDENYQVEIIDAETNYIKLYTKFISEGQGFNEGDEVQISFVNSSGSAANGIVDCAYDEDLVTNYFNTKELTIDINSASRAGSDEESDESIKNNAPLFYNTGNRVVSEDDYKAYLRKNSLVEEVNSWGGETILPMKLGHVFLSVVPQDTNFKYLTSLEEAELLSYMSKAKIMATGRKFKHPNYIYLDFEIKILGTLNDISSKKENIESTLENYFNEYQNTFGSTLFENKVIKQIEELFISEINASVRVVIKPKLLLSPELFNQDFDNGRLDIWIPNSTSKYYLTKDDDQINVPEDEIDVYSYLINGWIKEIKSDEDLSVDFSGTINSKAITYDATVGTVTIDSEDYDKQDLLIDGSPFGYFIPDLNILSLDDTIESDLLTDSDFIDLTYSPAMNIINEKSTLIKLGGIEYV